MKTTKMKKNLIVALFASMALSSAQAQGDTISSNWRLKAIYGVNGTQSSFVNWNAGGRNNISLLGYVAASAKYEKGNLKWDNDLGAALGGMQYLDQSTGNDLQKTDDRLELATNFGYRLKEHYYLSLLGSFRTQFIEGLDESLVRTSNFMAPGYVNLSLGIDYTPNDNFSAFLSPLASKMTFVTDPTLSAAGSFGVAAGETFRGEFGAYFKMKYNKELFKNIEMKSKLELFSNYIENPQNIDVNAEVLFSFKVNSWFSASLLWNLIYDDDIRITDSDGNTGPRTQFKSVLGLGVSYTMKNFTDK
jgi:opacity protein-like surface antigen